MPRDVKNVVAFVMRYQMIMIHKAQIMQVITKVITIITTKAPRSMVAGVSNTIHG
jgi:hypothetical protein